MQILIHRGFDPYFNLALEEYFLCKITFDVMILWRNESAVIVGRNQNTAAEIDSGFIHEKNIAVVRRLSGGGAVYHDKGNINFTVIQAANTEDFADYAKFTEPVLGFLNGMGIDAKLEGRNDLTIDGLKFCGNAQIIKNNRLMHHGCILYNSDIDMLSGALRHREVKFESKSVKSVRSRVTNIADHLDDPPSSDVFFESMADHFRHSAYDMEGYFLSPEETESISALSGSKYRTWDWNFGESPAYNFSNSEKFDAGFVDVRFFIKNGLIQTAKIYGDFFGRLDTALLEEKLQGQRHDRETLTEALKDTDLGSFIHGLSKEKFIGLLV